MNRKAARVTAALVLVGFGFGCSSTQQKQFYTLHGHSELAAEQDRSAALQDSLGIGPIELPELFSGDGIVSMGDDQQVLKSQTHLWAGDFKRTISRTIAANLSHHLASDLVWPFPWDTRNRPHKQVSVLVERLEGQLGQEVAMIAKWTLFDDRGKELVAVGRERFTAPTADTSYASYVAAVNDLVNQCSRAIARTVREQWVISAAEGT